MTWKLKDAIKYYRANGAPQDQLVLRSLLREVQENCDGAIPMWAVTKIAHKYEIKESYLLALIRRFGDLQLEDCHCLEICGSKSCKRSVDLQRFVEENYGAEPNFFVKITGCMHSCGTGPNIRWNGKFYPQTTQETLQQLIEHR